MSNTKPKEELKLEEIDDILDEIEQHEQQSNPNTVYVTPTDISWDTILTELKNGNVAFVKNIITSNDIEINAQNPVNGMTLLIYSVIIGNSDLIKTILNCMCIYCSS